MEYVLSAHTKHIKAIYTEENKKRLAKTRLNRTRTLPFIRSRPT